VGGRQRRPGSNRPQVLHAPERHAAREPRRPLGPLVDDGPAPTGSRYGITCVVASGCNGVGGCLADSCPPAVADVPDRNYAGGDVRVEVHESMATVQHAWEVLFTRDDRATPFSSPGWARAWWPHWAGDARALVLVAYDGEDPVALAPFFLVRRGPLRLLRGVGTIVGNYWDVLARPDVRGPATRAVVHALSDHRRAWDALVLDRLPEGSVAEQAVLASNLPLRRRRPIAAVARELPDSFDAFLASLPRKRRSKLRKHLRRIDEGDLERHQVSDPAALPAAIERWQALRAAWWRERGEDMLAEHGSERFREFMLAAARELVPAGLMVVHELRLDGEVVGVSVDLQDERTFYYWLHGFDPAIRALGPGTIHICASIRDSIEAGRRCYDFMVGQEPYKYEYGASDRHQPCLVISNRRPASRAALAASALMDRARVQKSLLQ
jgi:CelD/BcsL family acetyltransferase involved in cellulose biosynthesis